MSTGWRESDLLKPDDYESSFARAEELGRRAAARRNEIIETELRQTKPMADKDRNSRNIGIIAFMVSIPIMLIVGLMVEQFSFAIGMPKFIGGAVTFWVGVLCIGWVTLTNKRVF